jgi:hypothetical protein
MERILTDYERAMLMSEPRVALNFVLAVRLRGSLSTAQLREALRSLRGRYPLAGAFVTQDRQGRLTFTTQRAPEIQVRVVENANPGDWMRASADELADPFNPLAGPLVRTVLMRGEKVLDLLLVFHHAIADGTAALLFLRDLLILLDQPRTRLDAMDSGIPISDRLPPSISHNWFLKARLWFSPVGYHLQRLVTLIRKRGKTRPGRAIIDPAARGAFCVGSVFLPEDQTLALLDRCRYERTTVQAAVGTAWLRANAVLRPKGSRWFGKVSNSINLRGRLVQPAGEAFGAALSAVSSDVLCAAKSKFWWSARHIRRSQNRQMKSVNAFYDLLRPQAIASVLTSGQIGTMVAERMRFPVHYDVSVNHLGTLALPELSGPLQVEAVYGPVTSASGYDRSVGMLICGGRLMITFTFREDLLSPKAARELMELAVDELLAVTSR